MQIIGVIPARYASTRFPGKPLTDIRGKTMILRVYEQSLKAKSLSKVIVATDDERIKKHVEGFGGKAIMTLASHQTGTERCREVLGLLNKKNDVVINIQGDEPYIHPEQIDEVAGCFTDKSAEIATLIKTIGNKDELFNPNKPKVIINKNNEAIYFSRAAIPYLRGVSEKEWHKHHTYYKHIGLYGYRADILKKICSLPQSVLEKAESLEQLRWLEYGFKIKTHITEFESYSIDTPEDINNLPADL